MPGTLHIVATPIGNLGDITRRAVETLRDADLVAAEDTRTSQQLLHHLGLRKPMISLHEHNEQARVARILDELRQGRSVALISDAGTPLISDPGYPLVRAVREAGFRVSPVPGPSSVIAALSAAGLPTDRFCFVGFPPHKAGESRRWLETLKGRGETLVLFESTHRIERLLRQLDELMPDAELVLAKELTKRHERFLQGAPAQCLEHLQQDPLLRKGEFVVLIHPAEARPDSAVAVETDRLLELLLQELSLKKAVKLAAEISGIQRNELYRRALELTRSDADD